MRMQRKRLGDLLNTYQTNLMTEPLDFIKANISALGFSSKRDLIENLYLKSLVDSYKRVEQTVAKENEIRDRFMHDLHHHAESPLKKWLQLKVVYLDWENWKFTSDFKLARADISFKLTGIEFIVECKRLKSPSKLYFEEGLNRFVKLQYSGGDEYAGMIGFIINDKESQTLSGLKSRIRDYNYVESEFTASTFDLIPSSFLSSHTRIDNTQVNVYHMLFSFSKMSDT